MTLNPARSATRTRAASAMPRTTFQRVWTVGLLYEPAGGVRVMKLRELAITPFTRECSPSAMLRRKVTSTWEKMSAAQVLGSGSQFEGFRAPSGLPEPCKGDVPDGPGVGVMTGVGVDVAPWAACADGAARSAVPTTRMTKAGMTWA